MISARLISSRSDNKTKDKRFSRLFRSFIENVADFSLEVRSLINHHYLGQGFLNNFSLHGVINMVNIPTTFLTLRKVFQRWKLKIICLTKLIFQALYPSQLFHNYHFYHREQPAFFQAFHNVSNFIQFLFRHTENLMSTLQLKVSLIFCTCFYIKENLTMYLEHSVYCSLF